MCVHMYYVCHTAKQKAFVGPRHQSNGRHLTSAAVRYMPKTFAFSNDEMTIIYVRALAVFKLHSISLLAHNKIVQFAICINTLFYSQ